MKFKKTLRIEELHRHISRKNAGLLLLFICSSLMLSCTYLDNKIVEQADACSKYLFSANELMSSKKMIQIIPLSLTESNMTFNYLFSEPGIGKEGDLQLKISVTSYNTPFVKKECVIKFIFEEGNIATIPIDEIHIGPKGHQGKLLVKLEQYPEELASIKRHKIEKIEVCINTSTCYESKIKEEEQDYFQNILPCLDETKVRRWFKKNGNHNWHL